MLLRSNLGLVVVGKPQAGKGLFRL